MSAPARLGGYLAILAAVFTAAFLIGGAVIPQHAVDSWTEQAEQSTHAESPAAEH